MTDTTGPQTDFDRRERYATAISKWHRDPEQPLYAQGADAVMAVADAEHAELRRERDLAIAHDRQPYPTAWAYEQACKALRRKTEAIERVRALHVPDENGECRACGASFDPCPTIAALDTQPADDPSRLADEERDEQQAQANLDQLADGLAAAIASCPGRELDPSPCRCPCYGCKHHCGAHDPGRVGGEAQPRFVRVCIACPGCDHTLDENGACANGCHVPAAVVAEPGKENSRG